MGVTSLPAPTVTLEGAVRHIQERRVHVETVTGTFTVLLQASAPRLKPDSHVRVTGTLRRRTTLRASYYEVLAAGSRALERASWQRGRPCNQRCG